MISLQCMDCLPEVSLKVLAEQAVLDSRLPSLLDTLQAPVPGVAAVQR